MSQIRRMWSALLLTILVSSLLAVAVGLPASAVTPPDPVVVPPDESITITPATPSGPVVLTRSIETDTIFTDDGGPKMITQQREEPGR